MLASQSIPFTPRQRASIALVGLATIVTIGVTACVAIILALLWLIVHIGLLTLQAFIETAGAIATLYATADPLIKFLLPYAAYRVYRSIAQKEKGYLR